MVKCPTCKKGVICISPFGRCICPHCHYKFQGGIWAILAGIANSIILAIGYAICFYMLTLCIIFLIIILYLRLVLGW